MTATGASLAGTGPVRDLERALEDYLGVAHVLTVSSGTTAILVALQAAGVSRGDEVITTAYDWGAATAAILQVGAVPVFADVDRHSFTIAPTAVCDLITSRTRAIVATHLFGHPADMVELGRIATAAGLAVVGDAAQALGAKVNGILVTSFGDCTVLSFGPGKQLDGDGGGALVTDDSDVFDAAVRCSQHPLRQLREGLAVSHLAMNHRIHPSAAALVLRELDELDSSLRCSRRRAERCIDALRSVESVAAPVVAPWAEHAWHLTVATRSSAGAPNQFHGMSEGPISGLICDELLGVGSPAVPEARRLCALAVRLQVPDPLEGRPGDGPVDPTVQAGAMSVARHGMRGRSQVSSAPGGRTPRSGTVEQ